MDGVVVVGSGRCCQRRSSGWVVVCIAVVDTEGGVVVVSVDAGVGMIVRCCRHRHHGWGWTS